MKELADSIAGLQAAVDAEFEGGLSPEVETLVSVLKTTVTIACQVGGPLRCSAACRLSQPGSLAASRRASMSCPLISLCLGRGCCFWQLQGMPSTLQPLPPLITARPCPQITLLCGELHPPSSDRLHTHVTNKLHGSKAAPLSHASSLSISSPQTPGTSITHSKVRSWALQAPAAS